MSYNVEQCHDMQGKVNVWILEKDMNQPWTGQLRFVVRGQIVLVDIGGQFSGIARTSIKLEVECIEKLDGGVCPDPKFFN